MLCKEPEKGACTQRALHPLHTTWAGHAPSPPDRLLRRQNKAERHLVLLCRPLGALHSIGEKQQPRSHVNSCTSSPRIPLDPRGTASSTSPLQGVPVALHPRCPPLTSWHQGLSPAGLAQFCSQTEPCAEERLGGVGCAWLCSAPWVLACPAGRGVSETQGYVGWSFEPFTNDSHRWLLPI